MVDKNTTGTDMDSSLEEHRPEMPEDPGRPADEIYTYNAGNVRIITNVSKEEAETAFKARLRGAAKDAAVSAVISAKSAEKMAAETFKTVAENLKQTAEESKPKVEEGMKKFSEDMKKSIEAAKPVIEKASKDVGDFIEEVKEGVKNSEQ